jgi:hypothetical protein
VITATRKKTNKRKQSQREREREREREKDFASTALRRKETVIHR